MRFQGEFSILFLKITVTDQKSLPKIRDKSCNLDVQSVPSYLPPISFLRLFERGEFHFNGLFGAETQTFESNIGYTLRFMIDTKVLHNVISSKPDLIVEQVVGMNWIEVPAGKYSLKTGKSKKSKCQIELSVKCV